MGYMDEDLREDQEVIVFIFKRARGVYLTCASEQNDGSTDWDAFPTLAKAKAYLAAKCGKARLSWVQQGTKWTAETTVPGDWTFQ